MHPSFSFMYCGNGVSSFFSGQIAKSFIETVNVITPKTVAYTPFVVAKGTIATLAKENVRCDTPLYVSEVLVSEGDYINKGDVICTVSPEQTVNMILNQDMGDYYQGAYSEIDLDNLGNEIVSNCSGKVTGINVKENTVFTGGVVAVINGNDALCAEVTVNERNISEISVGDVADISGSGFGGVKYSGKVESIS